MILSLFRKDPVREAAEALHETAVEQARRPEFYTVHGVADSVEGRFELLALHVYLLLRRLKAAGGGPSPLSQRLLDALFANLDAALREMGVGDLSVGRKIRGLAESFYGRIGAYEAAMAKADDAALAAAIARNIYGNETATHAADLARYVRVAAAALDGQPTGRLECGIVRFPSPTPPQGAPESAP